MMLQINADSYNAPYRSAKGAIGKQQGSAPYIRAKSKIIRRKIRIAVQKDSVNSLDPRQVTQRRREAKKLARVLESVSPLPTLSRGYAIVRDQDSALVLTQKKSTRDGTASDNKDNRRDLVSKIEKIGNAEEEGSASNEVDFIHPSLVSSSAIGSNVPGRCSMGYPDEQREYDTKTGPY